MADAGRKGRKRRTEIIPTRFDPVLKMAVELAAARERRALAAMVEYIAEQAMKEWPIAVREGQPVSAFAVAEQCWHQEPYQRLVALATNYPELLTRAERQTWEAIEAIKRFETRAFTDSDDRLYLMNWTLLHPEVWKAVTDYADKKTSISSVLQVYEETRAKFPGVE